MDGQDPQNNEGHKRSRPEEENDGEASWAQEVRRQRQAPNHQQLAQRQEEQARNEVYAILQIIQQRAQGGKLRFYY